MLDNYIQLIKKSLEKLPFFNYIIRLIYYIKSPEITNTSQTKEQLEHSLLDVFNALGLVVVSSVLIVLYQEDYSHFNAYKVLNPLYVAASYISYGLFFSFFMALLVKLISMLPFNNTQNAINGVFYTIFCHSLRFYAAFGFFLGILFVHVIGTILTKGTTVEVALEHWFFYIYVLVTIVWFPIRLYIRPTLKLMSPTKYKWMTSTLVVLSILVVTTLNQFIPKVFGDKMLNHEELCKVAKSGNFYKKAEKNKKEKIEEYFCNQKVDK
ncbi:hypothetical protein AADZ91_07215 [Colwelliaceae bacterium 6441]